MTCTAPSVIMLTRARNCILGTAAYLLNQSALWQLGLYKNHTVVQFLTSSCLFSGPFGFFTLTLLCRSRLLGGGRVLCPVLDHPDRQCLKVEKKRKKRKNALRWIYRFEYRGHNTSCRDGWSAIQTSWSNSQLRVLYSQNIQPISLKKIKFKKKKKDAKAFLEMGYATLLYHSIW